jgi:hypothetical protein
VGGEECNRRGRPVGLYAPPAREGGSRVRFEYPVVRLWEVAAEEILASSPGLIPLVPFARGASVEVVERAFRALDRVRPRRRRTALQGALALFASNVFPRRKWLERIDEEVAMKFPLLDELEKKIKKELKTKLKQEVKKEVEEEVERKLAKKVERRVKEGNLAGQREVVVLQVRKLLGKRAGSLVARLRSCGAKELARAARVIATPGSKTELASALEAVLPRSD